jgi:peptidoglycan-associated lipoprotein
MLDQVQDNVVTASGRGRLMIVGAALLAVGLAGCSAKVKQDVFDQTIAELRGDIQSLDTQVADNASRIATHDQLLGELRTDLEALAIEFGEMQTAVVELEDGLRFVTPVHFEFDRADIRSSDRPVLDRFTEVVGKYYPAAVVTVEGFADPAGSVAYNQTLSERRARNVADYLTGEGGLDPAGIRVAAYGEDRQVVPGAQGPGAVGLENRRVTFVIELGGELTRETVATVSEDGGS